MWEIEAKIFFTIYLAFFLCLSRFEHRRHVINKKNDFDLILVNSIYPDDKKLVFYDLSHFPGFISNNMQLIKLTYIFYSELLLYFITI